VQIISPELGHMRRPPVQPVDIEALAHVKESENGFPALHSALQRTIQGDSLAQPQTGAAPRCLRSESQTPDQLEGHLPGLQVPDGASKLENVFHPCHPNPISYLKLSGR
jgi:hypothetical protein